VGHQRWPAAGCFGALRDGTGGGISIKLELPRLGDGRSDRFMGVGVSMSAPAQAWRPGVDDSLS